jgi:phosphatidylglycerol:prolipoprotein diacylglycerol transferase
MIDLTPSPIAIQIGPLPVYWYGLGYALGLALAYFVITREARRRGHDAEPVANGLIVVAVAALAGGRLYHVIDQWQNLYAADPIRAILPPYTGLGVYGGLVTGTIAGVLYARWKRASAWTWADIVAPGLFAMQAVGRWGNFFNQELYGPPTNLPWGIAIDCAHRVPEWPCSTYPFETTGFHPLFFYESVLSLIGAGVLLWAARRFGGWLAVGDLALFYFMWYSAERFGLEFFRAGYNYTFFAIPVTQIFATAFFVGAAVIFVRRHRHDWPPKAIPLPPAEELATLPGGIGAGPPGGDGAGEGAETAPA